MILSHLYKRFGTQHFQSHKNWIVSAVSNLLSVSYFKTVPAIRRFILELMIFWVVICKTLVRVILLNYVSRKPKHWGHMNAVFLFPDPFNSFFEYIFFYLLSQNFSTLLFPLIVVTNNGEKSIVSHIVPVSFEIWDDEYRNPTPFQVTIVS